MDARSQVDLFNGAAAHVVELQAKPVTVSRGALDHAGALKRHECAMRRALVEPHALTNLSQAQRIVARTKQIENRYNTVQAL
jgi:hypothetical protein